MPEPLPEDPENDRRLKRKAYCIAIPSILLATLPHAFFPFTRALAYSAAICALLVMAGFRFVSKYQKTHGDDAAEGEIQATFGLFLMLAGYSFIALLIPATSAGVFFHLPFFTALLYFVAISLGGSVFMTLAGIVFVACHPEAMQQAGLDTITEQ